MLPRVLAVVGLILGLSSLPVTSVAQQQPIVETTYCFETCYPTLLFGSGTAGSRPSETSVQTSIRIPMASSSL
jgi:hypothetical protein